MNFDFYKGKRVLVTGHTGFKGAWMCKMLLQEGANVIGYALKPPTTPNLFQCLELDKEIESIVGDIRNLDGVLNTFRKYRPEIVIHMAAQPIVRESYQNPVYTYETNVIGTVNVMEAVRITDSVKSVVNVTTDKVYKNNEWEWGYREEDVLDGYDPYSNSKSCSELVTATYRRSFLQEKGVAISTCRAGNVIGGGDFAKERIIPDCVRAAVKGKEILVRNPHSIRPYQHVLEPICAYLKLAELQYGNKKHAGNYNVGPDDSDCITTGKLVDLFCDFWGDGITWTDVSEKNAPHEANFLRLDCSRIKHIIKWTPRWHIKKAIENTVIWNKLYLNGGDICGEVEREILEYMVEGKI